MSRRSRIVLGASLTVVGLTGILVYGPALAMTPHGADPVPQTHEAMDAMPGPGTAARMHQIPGADETMEQCVAMMAATNGGMMGDGMMDGGTMKDMSGG
ncbi:MAG: hypothetical protein H0V96_03110 [Acidimicrobiia bacterium]|nr:hypothetical protein [Acidimicrobiia bacterium]